MASELVMDCNNCPVVPSKSGNQYRATKLWNEIVRSFRTHMYSKKHRRHLKTYSDCFTASGAVDVLHEILKSSGHFTFSVTRLQAVKLMRKFLKKHIIEDINGKWGNEDLDDGNRLYRFPSDDRHKDNRGIVFAASKKHPSVRALMSRHKQLARKGRPSQVYSPPVVKRFAVRPAPATHGALIKRLRLDESYCK